LYCICAKLALRVSKDIAFAQFKNARISRNCVKKLNLREIFTAQNYMNLHYYLRLFQISLDKHQTSSTPRRAAPLNASKTRQHLGRFLSPVTPRSVSNR